jgi:hypothetical protein
MDYIRHTLPPGGSFRLSPASFDALQPGGREDFRIVYCVCGGREPVYSGRILPPALNPRSQGSPFPGLPGIILKMSPSRFLFRSYCS